MYRQVLNGAPRHVPDGTPSQPVCAITAFVYRSTRRLAISNAAPGNIKQSKGAQVGIGHGRPAVRQGKCEHHEHRN